MKKSFGNKKKRHDSERKSANGGSAQSRERRPGDSESAGKGRSGVVRRPGKKFADRSEGVSRNRSEDSRAAGRRPGSDRSARAGRDFQGRRESNKRPDLGTTFEARVESFTHTGEAIVHIEHYVLFVRGVIPGEYGRFRVVSAGRRFGRAIVERILQASPHRVTPRCQHFGECGRCAMQHVDTREQLRVKENILRSVLNHALPRARLPVAPMIAAASPFGARFKAHFVLGQSHGELKADDANELSELPTEGLSQPRSRTDDRTRQLHPVALPTEPVLAHYRSASREILPIVECPVHDDLANKAAFALLAALKKRGIKAVAQPTHEGIDVAKHAVIRVSSSARKSLVLLVASGEQLPELESLGRDVISLEPTVAGVHLNVNPHAEPVVLGSTTRCLAGEDSITQSILGIDYVLSPTSFFQTSPQGAEALVRIAMRAVPRDAATVLDLYCGVGLFSLPLAKRGHRVIGVEQNPRAIEDAQKAAELNNITGCEFRTGKAEDILKKLSKREKIDVVVLDPPRDGCPDWALRLIARGFRPKYIVDVSCDPRSLVRDLEIFLASGYRPLLLQPIDMFPQTSQIETVAIFERIHKRGHGGVSPERSNPHEERSRTREERSRTGEARARPRQERRPSRLPAKSVAKPLKRKRPK